MVGKNLKQHASESGDEEVEQSDLDDSVPKATKKRQGKQQQIEDSEESLTRMLGHP